MLDLSKLRLFYWVAKYGSYTKASKEIALSQPSLVRQMQALEESLGCKLFNRHFRGISLTQEGEKLFETTIKILAQADALEQSLKQTQEPIKETLKIGTTTGISADWLVRFIPSFVELYPHIKLNVLSYTTDFDLDKNNIDAAIRNKIEGEKDLIQKHLYTFEFKLYASKEYLKKYGYPQIPKDLDNHRLIGFADDEKVMFQEVDILLQGDTIDQKKRNYFITINSNIAEFKLAEQGVGIASIWPGLSLLKDSSLVEVLPSMKSMSIDIYYIYHKHVYNTEKVELLYNHIKKALHDGKLDL
ncbi:MAG: LysR family transcriptional regulator [Candidatus Paracaedimonas acanthamoebae]|jgi:DNA-binding transcriptional LysR family regulator|uniref:LysR family transcriptional regulator n=1 Tax=Candidatus Paracaedimonas acanthamoebae TaxID=244581 RepID=A0A8J7PW56_9PROT|nr:LysR family transcriptional regulator [Candidatus Paracaedimonas acanthamoebae]